MNVNQITKTGFFGTLIGKKTLMALTGLFLSLFLGVHASGNLQLFKNDDGLAFNQYSVFMTTFPPIKIVSYLLYASILAHAIDALILTLANQKARPQAYAVNKPSANSSWASRNMGLLGSVLLFFIIIHLSDFWWSYKFGQVPVKKYTSEFSTGNTTSVALNTENQSPLPKNQKMIEYMPDQNTRVVIVKDLYSIVQEAFKNPFIVLVYLASMISVAFHLLHGFQSAFQTLGINHPKYTPLIKKTGTLVFGIIIPLLFASMPLYFFLK